ncbi:zinc/manganese transport system substrate-binding protein [Thiogranum longum]|uniref:Zinc/manganese transport system substrate-binding protein n=1 Tax=Thiogranum longum TaxID=1537524 RepID=A0A4R1HB44_9GAMM|nr:zinc ABC transporter substrate-binding protein [Thiogranum longum]TCK17733.1 zinc/manganese transport system substrate-binding protein [Thiogranum longum]
MLRFMLWFGVLFSLPLPVMAAISVFACEPEWAALTREIAGEQVKVSSATNALQDPHHIQARPSLISRMRKADLVICTGAGLEAGWLPLLLRRANNPQILPGQPGYVEASSAVTLLDRPQRLDRAQGDIHASGNPHIQMNPNNLTAVARLLAQRLAVVDPEHAGQYRNNLDDFLQRWQAAISRWEKQAAPLKGMAVVVQHNSWLYLEQWLGLKQVATIEPKPGVPPSSADLARLVRTLEQHPASAILHAAYQDDRASKWLSRHTGIAEVSLPFTVGGSEKANDLFGLYDDTLQRLLAVVP